MIFSEFLKQTYNFFSMASYDFNINPYSSDEEEVFAGFSVEEIAEIRQRRQHQDREIEEMFDESGTNSDVEFFASGDEDDEEEDDESNESADEDALPDPLQWSNTLSDINVEEFSVCHGPTKDLGGQATSKDFLNLFINDDYLDEIARCSVAYARSKGDESFVINRAEISAYLGLNILMGIHRLPQLEMFWDSDEFIGVEDFKKTIPKQRFKTLGKYLHLVDPGDEDANDVLCKVRSLVTLLEDKFADAYIPERIWEATFWEDCKAEKKLVPCVQKLAGNAVKDAHSRHLSDVNSAVFHCVDKCVVKSPASPNGMEAIKRCFIIFYLNLHSH